MITHITVEFDSAERETLTTASLSLGVAFPDFRTPTRTRPNARVDRTDGQRASIIAAMGQRHGNDQWSHKLLVDAARLMLIQIHHLEEQSSLEWWLNYHSTTGRPPVEKSDDPTSAYAQYRAMAEVRSGQLRPAREAHAILIAAANATASHSQKGSME